MRLLFILQLNKQSYYFKIVNYRCMKARFLIVALLCIFSCFSFGQTLQPAQPVSKEYYLMKSKKQTRAAAYMALGGCVLITTGLIATLIKISDDGTFLVGGLLILTGGGVILSSIPLTIASRKNKKRYMNFSFKQLTMPQGVPITFIGRYSPSLSFKIPL